MVGESRDVKKRDERDEAFDLGGNWKKRVPLSSPKARVSDLLKTKFGGLGRLGSVLFFLYGGLNLKRFKKKKKNNSFNIGTPFI